MIIAPVAKHDETRVLAKHPLKHCGADPSLTRRICVHTTAIERGN